MKTNVIKLRFIRHGEPSGREYTYFTNTEVAVDDLVDIDGRSGLSQGIVTAIDVPEKEIEPFKDIAKTILGKTAQNNKAEFVAKSVHCGQYKPYGDFFRVWEIETDCNDKEKVLEYCFSELDKRRLPEKDEWHRNIRHGTGEKSGDASYYFRGYHMLEKTDKGYKFTVCEPWCD